MKATFKVFSAIMLLGMVILLGLHIFLQAGLTKAMREVVLPRIKKEKGVDVHVNKLSLNIPNGILNLVNVEVRNPDGFKLENMVSIERISLEVDLLSLLKKQLISVKNIEMKGGVLNFIYDKDGNLNIDVLFGRKTSDGETPSDIDEASRIEDVQEILIDNLYCSASLRYLDLRIEDLDLVLDLNIIGSNLSTKKDPDSTWGLLTVIGSSGSPRSRCVTDLKIKVAPLVDLKKPSFDVDGTVYEIDSRILNKPYDKLGIRSSPFGLESSLRCRNGQFENSKIILNLKDIELEDELGGRLGGIGGIKSLNIPLPLSGSLQKPHLNLEEELFGAVGGTGKGLFGKFLNKSPSKETE